MNKFQENKVTDILEGIPPQTPTKKQRYYLEIAKEIAIKKCKMRARHCSLIQEKSKISSIGINNNATHVTSSGNMSYHSECKCIENCNINKLKDAIMYIVRIGYDNENFMNSAPCHICFCVIVKYIKKKNLKKVIFSMPNGKIHIMDRHMFIY